MQNTKPQDSSEKHRREDHCQVNSCAISGLGVGGSRREPFLLGERRRSALDLSAVLRGHSDFPIQLSIYWVRSSLVPHQYTYIPPNRRRSLLVLALVDSPLLLLRDILDSHISA